MKKLLIIKVGLAFLLMLNSLFVSAITFNTSSLKDSSSSNYIGFTLENGELNDKFEKIIEDFNGDGIDDILSLGGPINCSLCSPQPPPLPVELLLNKDGEYVYHKINISYNGKFATTVDIDGDEDIDIIFSNGKIAINDGSANFILSQYSEINQNSSSYAMDWNNDNVLDIVNQYSVFINDGNLNFTEIENPVPSSIQMVVADLTANTDNDVLVLKDNEIQSWILSNGEYSLGSTFELENTVKSIHAIDVNSDGASDIVTIQNTESGPHVQLLTNDGQGLLSLSDFEFSNFSDVPFDEMEVTKVFVQDGDGDGDDELWINTTFTSNEMLCEDKQYLLLIYDNIDDGNLQFKRSLHSTGYQIRNYLFTEIETENFPTLIDLNQDNKLDVVMPGDKPIAWLQGSEYYFHLSNISSLQFNNHIEVVDFNNDGNADILSSGKYKGSCEALPYKENIYSINDYSAGGRLWLGDGIGEFEPYSTGIAGLDRFDSPSEYSILVDVFQDGNYLAINTRSATDEYQRQTTVAYPRLADPGIHGDFPEPTLLIKSADLTNNGKLELVMLADTQEAAIYVMGVPSTSPLPSQVIAKLEFGFPEGEIKLEDMDGDGFIDIITNSKSQTAAVTIWYNNGDSTFDPSVAFADGVKAIAISDFDGDGKKDIFTSNINQEIWFNQGSREFEVSEYNKSFWRLLTTINPDNYFELVPEKIEVTDINGDGLDDLSVYIQNNVHVYLNDSGEDVSFYKNYSSSVIDYNHSNHLGNSNIAFADFNNDGRMDFVSGSDNFVKINLQVDENIKSGLYYDPEFNGHGFSVEELDISSLYYSVLYTYDEFGKPDWYSMLNRYEANEDIWQLKRLGNNTKIHYIYDYETGSTIIDDTYENTGWFNFSNEKENGQLGYTLIRIADMPSTWNLAEIVNDNLHPENDLSGIWWAGVDDAGWGISLSFVQREVSQEVVAILYFYDEFGQPRWLIGQADGFELNQDIVVDMKQINGYGRLQNHVELTELSAGTITINLQQATKNIDDAGSLSMDVFYPEDQVNDNWIRNNIPISLFSKPRTQ